MVISNLTVIYSNSPFLDWLLGIWSSFSQLNSPVNIIYALTKA